MTDNEERSDASGPLVYLIEALTARDTRGVPRLCTPDIQLRDMAREWTATGMEEVRAALDAWLAAAPDLTIDVVNLAETKTRGGAELIVRGTHSGTFEDDWGDVPPSGNAIELRLVVTCVLDDGRIASARAYYDLATLLVQVGAL